MADKTEFLEWLLKSRSKGYPFVTFRGSVANAIINLEIPFDDIEKYFGVDKVVIRGKVWEKNKNRSRP